MRMFKIFFERLPSKIKLIIELARWLRIDFNKKNKIGDDKNERL